MGSWGFVSGWFAAGCLFGAVLADSKQKAREIILKSSSYIYIYRYRYRYVDMHLCVHRCHAAKIEAQHMSCDFLSNPIESSNRSERFESLWGSSGIWHDSDSETFIFAPKP